MTRRYARAALENGDHAAGTQSVPEQTSQAGSDRMTVTVCPQPAQRNAPDAVAASTSRLSVFSTSAISVRCAHTARRGNAAARR